MNRLSLVNKLALKLGSKKEAREVIDFIFTEITKSLQRNERVLISQFGTFTLKLRKGRELYNPRTGEKMRIPAKRVVRFRPSKGLD